MREMTLNEMFVRDLDQIPLPPRAQWIRPEVAPRSRRLHLSPAFATAVVALLIVAVLVGLQTPAVQHVLDQLRRGIDRSDPSSLPALRVAVRQMVDLELTRPTLPALLDGATRRIELLLRDRAIPVSFASPARSGSFDDDVRRYAAALRDLSDRSGIPISELQDAAIQGVAAFEGECGSSYHSKAEAQAFERAALFAGTIGVTFRQSVSSGFGHEVVVVRAGSPAERAGLRAGDVIRSVDGRSAANPGELAGLLRGNPGSTVTLGVERGGQRIFDMRVERAALARPDAVGRLIDGNIGHLDLRSDIGSGDVRAAIAQLRPDARAWILDLRQDAWSDADRLEPLLVGLVKGRSEYAVAIDRDGRETPLRTDALTADAEPTAVIVLVNAFTSTSPLVVAAVIDDDGGGAVGEPTSKCANRFRVVNLESGDLHVRTQYVVHRATRRDLRGGVSPDALVRQSTGPGDAILDAAVARLRAQLR